MIQSTDDTKVIQGTKLYYTSIGNILNMQEQPAGSSGNQSRVLHGLTKGDDSSCATSSVMRLSCQQPSQEKS